MGTPGAAEAPLQLCQLERAAKRFGYALRTEMVAGRGLVWLAIPARGVVLTIGDTSEVYRFLENHARWMARGPEGLARIRLWREQKLRAAARDRIPASLRFPEARRR